MYSLLAYRVSRQLKDIAIRIALGAKARDILGWILRDGGGAIAVAVPLGIALAVAAAQTLRSVLFGISGVSAAAFGVVLLTLLVLTIVASCLPVLSALRLDLVRVLRHE